MEAIIFLAIIFLLAGWVFGRKKKCKLCTKREIVNKDGVCKRCAAKLAFDTTQKFRIINDSIRIVEQSKNWKTRLSRCELVLQHARDLLVFEEKQIKTVDPTPSQLISKYEDLLSEIILDGISSNIEKELIKAEAEDNPAKKLNYAKKARDRIIEAKKDFRDYEINLDQIENHVKKFLHKYQLDSYIKEARKAEFKGQKKKALNQYQEALFFLQNDDVDDALQKGKIEEINAKISELSH